MPYTLSDQDTRNRVLFARHMPPEALHDSFQADLSFRDRGSHLSFLKNHQTAPGPDELYPWYDVDTRLMCSKLLGLDLRYPELPTPPAAHAYYSSTNHYRSHIHEIFGHPGVQPQVPLEGHCQMYMCLPQVLEIRYTLRATGPGPVQVELRFHSEAAAPYQTGFDNGDLIVHGVQTVQRERQIAMRLWGHDHSCEFHADPANSRRVLSRPIRRSVAPGTPLVLTFRCTLHDLASPPPRCVEPGQDLDAVRAEHDDAWRRVPPVPDVHAPYRALVSTAAGTLRSLRYQDITADGRKVTTIHAGKCGVAATWWWDTGFAMLGLAAMGARDSFTGAATLLTDFVAKDGNPPCKILRGEAVGGAQNPNVAWGIGHFLAQHPDPELLARVYEPLRRYVHWWRSQAVSGYDGLVRYPQGVCWDDAQRWHTGHPIGQTVPWHQARPGQSRAGLFLSVDTNSHYYLELATMARLATALGRAADAAEFADLAAKQAAAINEHLYNPESGCYEDRDHTDGRFTGMLTPACFMPIYAGIAPADRAERLCRELLLDPAHFYTTLPFPTLDRAHPHFRSGGQLFEHPNFPGSLVQEAYWIGRTWPHVSFWMVGALHRAGLAAEADAAADRILDALSRHSTISEVYDSITGQPTGHPEFMWSSAAVLLLAYQHYRHDPVPSLG